MAKESVAPSRLSADISAYMQLRWLERRRDAAAAADDDDYDAMMKSRIKQLRLKCKQKGERSG